MGRVDSFDPRNRFLKSLPRQAQLLDVGCGSFRTLNKLRAHRPDIRFFGVDIEDVSAQCPDSVTFKQVDLDHQKLPFQDEFFDAIFFCHVLEHLIYPMKALAEIKRVLKPGGQIYIEGPSVRSQFLPSFPSLKSSGVLKAVGDDLNFYDNFTHVRPLSKRSLHMFLELASCEPNGIGYVRNPFRVLIAPFLVLGGLLLLRRRWLCVGLWELVGWSVYAMGRKKTA